jgi:hypothetical protein
LRSYDRNPPWFYVVLITTLEASATLVEAPAVAMATAAKTAVWVWRPTPGPSRKSRGALMALVTLPPQLPPLFQERRGDENKKYEDACASGQLLATAKWSEVDVL